jgi:hypothetical protein
LLKNQSESLIKDLERKVSLLERRPSPAAALNESDIIFLIKKHAPKPAYNEKQ